MAKYCITAANHKNRDNHIASSFLLWQYDELKKAWIKLGGKSAKEVVGLVENPSNKVLTGKTGADGKTPITGEEVEVELRIAKNKVNYDISKMPTF